jgi:hypothetical protein
MALRMPWAAGPDPEDALELGAFDPQFRGAWGWEQAGRFRARWRLTCDGAPVAALATHGIFAAPSLARFRDEAWELKYRFPAEMAVTRRGDAQPWAHWRPGWFGSGKLVTSQGSTLLWGPDGFWMRSWSFTTPDQIPLVTFRPARAFLRFDATIEIQDAARRLPELPALLALGWLLVMRIHRGRHGG